MLRFQDFVTAIENIREMFPQLSIHQVTFLVWDLDRGAELRTNEVVIESEPLHRLARILIGAPV